MSLIALCADKGRPGVTTAALALAAIWPRRAAVAELDQAGGDLVMRLTNPAGRYVLAPRPSLPTWAAAVQLGSAAGRLWEHCQDAGGGRPPVLVGAAGADQAAGLVPLWPQLAEALALTQDGDVLADLGRLAPSGPLTPIVAAAELRVVVAAATVESLVHTRDRVRALLAAGDGAARTADAVPDVAVLLVASDRHGPAAVDAAQAVLDRDGLPARAVGFLALDRAAVVALQQGGWTGWHGRSLLARTAREAASRLYEMLPAPPAGDPSAQVASSGGRPQPAEVGR